jgi:small subunit ribosomal protein S17
MNNRRRLIGNVVSDKMQKTVVVEVTRTYRHRLYQKVVSSKNRFMAHDELACRIGDQVRIVESRPISRRKRWAVEEVLIRAGEAVINAAEEVLE